MDRFSIYTLVATAAGFLAVSPVALAQSMGTSSSQTIQSRDNAAILQNYPSGISSNPQVYKSSQIQVVGGSRYKLRLKPGPNYDNSPIPNGDYGSWTGQYPGGPQY